MSGAERIVIRRQQRTRNKVVRFEGQQILMSAPTWWDSRYADLVERRIVTDREWGHSTITYTPRPKRARVEWSEPVVAAPMTERPYGMSRQVQRKLYRQACKFVGVIPTRAR